MKSGLLALALMLLAPPAIAAEPIGRLFFTPEQRSSLDVARSKRARNVVSTEKTEEASAPPPSPTAEIVTYGGMVRRSDGKTTVWLNNRAVSGKEASDGKIVGRIRPDGTVTLRSAQTGRNVDLRVGQRAELLSGRVEEGYRHVAPPKPEARTDVPGTKPAPDTSAAAEAERKKEERERQENLDDAVRALRDAAQARSVAPQTAPSPVPAPLQQAGTPPPLVVAPPPAPAAK